MGILSQKFARDTLERAIKTAAQVALAGMGVAISSEISGGTETFSGVNWPMVGDMVLYSVVASCLMSVASAAFNDSDSASLVK